MNVLPFRKKLEKFFPEFMYSAGPDLNIVYKRDPFIYGPEVICIFDNITKTVWFEGNKYSVDQFGRVLDLLIFI